MAQQVQPSLGACPICDQRLLVTEYACRSCGTAIRGRFDRCDLCALPGDLLHFVRLFLRVEGNLREVERRLGLSYPTVKARLAAVNAALDAAGAEPAGPEPVGGDPAGPDPVGSGQASASAEPHRDAERLGLLRRLRGGELSFDQVMRRLDAEGAEPEGKGAGGGNEDG